MPFMYAEYMTKLMAPKPYPPQPRFDAPKLTPFFKPIEESTIGVLTSCGAQLKDDKPMAETNDLSYRLLHRDIPLVYLRDALYEMPFQWSEDGSRDWEAELKEIYRRGLSTFENHVTDHTSRGESLIGKEQEFAIRCNC